VDPAAELGVFVVLGRQPAVNEDDVWPDKVIIEGERDEHDGEQWLAICSEDVATHMAHQGFTMATKTEEEGEPGASGDQSQSAANLSKEAGRPAQGRRTRRLVRLAELKGRDLVGLSVRCTSVGAEQQESRTVPISPDQPDSKAKGDKEWAKDHIVFVASGGDDTTPPGYPLCVSDSCLDLCFSRFKSCDRSMADKQRVERVLASRDTFRYYACGKDILSLAGESVLRRPIAMHHLLTCAVVPQNPLTTHTRHTTHTHTQHTQHTHTHTTHTHTTQNDNQVISAL
jgi:hypothetical protein